MKKLLVFLFIISGYSVRTQTCTAAFTCNIVDTTVSFINLTTASNAHYYWDFGNGNSSNIKDPVHQYL